MKRNKPTEDESPTPDPEVEVNIEKTTGNSKKEERANSPNTDYKVEFNDTFYNSTVTEGDKSIFLSPSSKSYFFKKPNEFLVSPVMFTRVLTRWLLTSVRF